MSKRIRAWGIGLLVLALVLGISALASYAQSSFWVNTMAFHYLPDYGELKEGLADQIPFYDVLKQLRPGTGASFSGGWQFSEVWGIRVDSFSFIGKADYHHKRLSDIFYFETSTSPVLLSVTSLVYSGEKLQSYLGMGAGIFFSELAIQGYISGRESEEHYEDSPLGFQLLMGSRYRLADGLFLYAELRYLSAQADYPGYRCLESCSTDWSGLFVSIGVGCKFGGQIFKERINETAF